MTRKHGEDLDSNLEEGTQRDPSRVTPEFTHSVHFIAHFVSVGFPFVKLRLIVKNWSLVARPKFYVCSDSV